MIRFFSRRGNSPRQADVVRRKVVTLDRSQDCPDVYAQQVQQEIRNVMRDQQPGRYRVEVRRRAIR